MAADSARSPAPIDGFESLAALGDRLAARSLGARELTECLLARIDRADPRLGAFVAVEHEAALAQADAADALIRSGCAPGPLTGVPLAIKDLFDVEGARVTVGSPEFAARRAPCAATATAVARLRAAGAVILGRTRMVEFAYGGWGTNAAVGTPRNPWDDRVHRVPGGSSSGSAVAVAAGLVPAALGTDTAGSIRIPAALEGITGLKPTYGRIPLTGVFPLAASVDSVGTLAHSAEDCGLLLAALAGGDAGDPASRQAPPLPAGFDARGRDGIEGMRIGRLDAACYPVEVEADTERALDETARVLASLGARVAAAHLPLPMAEMTRRAGTIVAAEAFELHRARLDDASFAFTTAVRQRLESGRDIGALELDSLRDRRRTDRALIAGWMQDFDALLLPCVPGSAPAIADIDEAGSPLGAFVRWVNHAGACALSLPAGCSQAGLPLAVQLVAAAFEEPRLLAVGRAVQRATDWHRLRPARDWGAA